MHKKIIQPQSSKALISAIPYSNRNQKIKITLLWLSLVSVWFLSACSSQDIEKAEDAGDSEISVSSAMAQKETYSPRLNLTGTVFANQEANLGAGFPGRVEKIHYPEGTFVRKDQLLVEMAGEMLAQAEAEYTTLKRDYERVARLVKNGTVSRQEYDHVKARFDASRAKYELARKNTRIRAPFNGTIVDYMVNEGENYFLNFNLEPGYSSTSGILRLMQLDPVKIQVEVNERDLANIRPGLEAQVIVDAFPDEEFSGQISLIKPYLSTRSRTSTVEIRIPNPDLRLKPGMFARVSILLPEKEAVWVPMEAVYRDPETDTEMIYVIRKGSVVAHEVQRMAQKGDLLEISHIQNGDEVVVGGKNRVREGDLVTVVNNGGTQ